MPDEVDWLGWFTHEDNKNVDLNLPGIYEWHVEGVGSYVRKSKRLFSRRLKEYPQ